MNSGYSGAIVAVFIAITVIVVACRYQAKKKAVNDKFTEQP